MRFQARRMGPHFYVNGLIESPLFARSTITFLLDTGCSITTLLPFDVQRLGLPWRRLDYDSLIQTGQGTTRPRKVPDVTVMVPGRGGFLNRVSIYIIQQYPYINAMDPTFQCGPYSLLGMDFLLNFRRWGLHDGYVVLDT